MSHYTTEVRYICEHYAGVEESKGFDSVEEILAKSAPKVFDFSFPIFDENYRLVLEKKILKHYYTREIGAETVGLWKLWLDARMNEIMPYYNKLYESELIEFNPMYNADYTRTYQKGNEGENNGVRNINGLKVDKMTGTIVDDGSDVLKQTGTIKSDTEYDEKYTGDVTNTGTVTNVLDRDTENTNISNVKETGTDTNAKTGFDKHDKTGTETLVKTGTETLEKTGNEEANKTGTETENKTGTEAVSNSGTDTRTDNLHETRSSHDKTNRWDYYNDTPQGGIDGVEDLEYLTNVRHITDDGTGSGGSTDNTGTQATKFGKQTTTTFNTQDQTTYAVKDKTDYDLSDKTTFNTQDQTTYNTEDKDTYNSTNTETKNLQTETITNETGSVDENNTRTDNLKTEYDTDKAGTNEKTDTFNKTDTKDKDNTRTYNTTNTITDETGETNKMTVTNMEDYTEHVIGKMPYVSFSRMLEEFRDTFLNIDLMIIEELSDLFMLIY